MLRKLTSTFTYLEHKCLTAVGGLPKTLHMMLDLKYKLKQDMNY